MALSKKKSKPAAKVKVATAGKKKGMKKSATAKKTPASKKLATSKKAKTTQKSTAAKKPKTAKKATGTKKSTAVKKSPTKKAVKKVGTTKTSARGVKSKRIGNGKAANNGSGMGFGLKEKWDEIMQGLDSNEILESDLIKKIETALAKLENRILRK